MNKFRITISRIFAGVFLIALCHACSSANTDTTVSSSNTTSTTRTNNKSKTPVTSPPPSGEVYPKPVGPSAEPTPTDNGSGGSTQLDKIKPVNSTFGAVNPVGANVKDTTKVGSASLPQPAGAKAETNTTDSAKSATASNQSVASASTTTSTTSTAPAKASPEVQPENATGETLREVPTPAIDLVPPGLKSKTRPVTVIGEVVDSWCFSSGTMGPGSGPHHKACALACIAGGVTPGIAEEKTGVLWVATKYKGYKGCKELLLPYVARRVKVTGWAAHIGMTNNLKIDTVEALPDIPIVGTPAKAKQSAAAPAAASGKKIK